MPLYPYRCPQGHETDVLAPMAAKPVTATCEACGLEARAVPGRPAPTMGCVSVPERPRRDAGRGWDMHEMACDACEHEWIDVTRDDEPPPAVCEACGSPNVRRKPTASNVQAVVHYPYWDRSLAMWVTSAQHLRDTLKARGLQDLTGETAYIERAVARQRADLEAEDAKADQYFHDLEHHPKFAAYRRDRDHGLLESLLPPDPGSFQLRSHRG